MSTKFEHFFVIFFVKKRHIFDHFFEHKKVAIIFTPGKSAAHHTSQENESEILLKFCEKIVVFRCGKNYRLDLLRCMTEILKLRKNDFCLFLKKKMVSVFWQKTCHFFLAKNVTFFDSFFQRIFFF
jgi:hypothetical protein